jgi:hypothetical protein
MGEGGPGDGVLSEATAQVGAEAVGFDYLYFEVLEELIFPFLGVVD